jgi:hypothetical protein
MATEHLQWEPSEGNAAESIRAALRVEIYNRGEHQALRVIQANVGAWVLIENTQQRHHCCGMLHFTNSWVASSGFTSLCIWH